MVHLTYKTPLRASKYLVKLLPLYHQQTRSVSSVRVQHLIGVHDPHNMRLHTSHMVVVVRNPPPPTHQPDVAVQRRGLAPTAPPPPPPPSAPHPPTAYCTNKMVAGSDGDTMACIHATGVQPLRPGGTIGLKHP